MAWLIKKHSEITPNHTGGVTMRHKTLHIERTTVFVSTVVIYKKANRPLETQQKDRILEHEAPFLCLSTNKTLPIVSGHKGRSKKRGSYLYSYIAWASADWPKCENLTDPAIQESQRPLTSRDL